MATELKPINNTESEVSCDSNSLEYSEYEYEYDYSEHSDYSSCSWDKECLCKIEKHIKKLESMIQEQENKAIIAKCKTSQLKAEKRIADVEKYKITNPDYANDSANNINKATTTTNELKKSNKDQCNLGFYCTCLLLTQILVGCTVLALMMISQADNVVCSTYVNTCSFRSEWITNTTDMNIHNINLILQCNMTVNNNNFTVTDGTTKATYCTEYSNIRSQEYNSSKASIPCWSGDNANSIGNILPMNYRSRCSNIVNNTGEVILFIVLAIIMIKMFFDISVTAVTMQYTSECQTYKTLYEEARRARIAS